MLKPSKRIISAFAMSAFAIANLTTAFAAEIANNDKPDLDRVLFRNGFKFDHEKWWLGYRNVRQLMVADLVHSYSLIGMEKSAVHGLLGEPQTDPASTYKAPQNSEAYELNSPRCGSVPVNYLDVVYVDGQVKEYCVREVARGEVPPSVYTSQSITKNLKW